MSIVLPKSYIHEYILQRLRAKYPEKLDVDTTYCVLYVKDKVKIKRNDIYEIIKELYPHGEQAKRYTSAFWSTWLINRKGLDVEFTNDSVILYPRNRVTLTIRIDKELYDKLRKYARKHGKTMSDVIRDFINSLQVD